MSPQSSTAGVFLVDVEATDATPLTGVMTEFGVVHFDTRDWFHGHLYDFHPDPDVPARPIADRMNPGFTIRGTPSGVRHPTSSVKAMLAAFSTWLRQHAGAGGRCVFVSDNPGFDFMWMACEFDRAGIDNPFGHSSRRIGDFAAGLAGDWRQASRWKRLRRTRHDHNPVNDSLGNAEALEALLRIAEGASA